MSGAVYIPWREIAPGDGVNGIPNDRVDFSHVAALAADIKQNGQHSPVTVTPKGADGLHRLILGGSRWRACKLNDSPVLSIVKDADADTQAAMMLSENENRKDLTDMERARAYQSRIDAGWTIDRLVSVTGKRRDYIEDTVTLLRLHPELQHMVGIGGEKGLGRSYALAMTKRGLDYNFQMLAVRALRECPSPSLAWFAGEGGVCDALLEKQSTASLFDLALFSETPVSEIIAAAAYKEPPLPGRDAAPVKGAPGPRGLLLGQAKFWRVAAEDWGKLGKTARRDECNAAAAVLERAADALPDDPKPRAPGEGRRKPGLARALGLATIPTTGGLFGHETGD